MEDATKAWPFLRQVIGRNADSVEESDGAIAPDSAEDGAQVEKASTNEKALDRWFREQRGSKRVPKRLEVSNEALVTSGGPLKITGNITLIDEKGEITHANHLTLCRCGHSRSKPICDDQHVDTEFLDNGNIRQVSDCMPIKRPQTVTMTCVRDGPLKYRGYLRVYNRKGQECLSMQGHLCRCGKSTRKPFCDCI